MRGRGQGKTDEPSYSLQGLRGTRTLSYPTTTTTTKSTHAQTPGRLDRFYGVLAHARSRGKHLKNKQTNKKLEVGRKSNTVTPPPPPALKIPKQKNEHTQKIMPCETPRADFRAEPSIGSTTVLHPVRNMAKPKTREKLKKISNKKQTNTGPVLAPWRQPHPSCAAHMSGVSPSPLSWTSGSAPPARRSLTRNWI